MKYLLIFLVSVSVSAWAEEDEDFSSTLTQGRSESLYSFSMGTGLHLMDARIGWSANFRVQRNFTKTSPWSAGVEAGMTFWNLQNPNFPFFANVQLVRVSPSISYRATISKFPWMHPFAGIGLGIDIFGGQGLQNPMWSQNLKGAQFEISGRIGMAFDLSDSFYISIEPTVGLSGGHVFVNPLFNAVLFL